MAARSGQHLTRHRRGPPAGPRLRGAVAVLRHPGRPGPEPGGRVGVGPGVPARPAGLVRGRARRRRRRDRRHLRRHRRRPGRPGHYAAIAGIVTLFSLAVSAPTAMLGRIWPPLTAAGGAGLPGARPAGQRRPGQPGPVRPRLPAAPGPGPAARGRGQRRARRRLLRRPRHGRAGSGSWPPGPSPASPGWPWPWACGGAPPRPVCSARPGATPRCPSLAAPRRAARRPRPRRTVLPARPARPAVPGRPGSRRSAWSSASTTPSRPPRAALGGPAGRGARPGALHIVYADHPVVDSDLSGFAAAEMATARDTEAAEASRRPPRRSPPGRPPATPSSAAREHPPTPSCPGPAPGPQPAAATPSSSSAGRGTPRITSSARSRSGCSITRPTRCSPSRETASRAGRAGDRPGPDPDRAIHAGELPHAINRLSERNKSPTECIRLINLIRPRGRAIFTLAESQP